MHLCMCILAPVWNSYPPIQENLAFVGYVLYSFHENFLVLNFQWVVRVHGFVHGFAHGIGARWFSTPGIFVDPVKGTTAMF